MIADWSEEQQKKFIIKDNDPAGEWDWAVLQNEWNLELISGWGLDVPRFAVEATDDAYEIPTEVQTNIDRSDWTATWQLSPAAVAYVWHGGIHAEIVAKSLAAADLIIRSQIIWNKPSLVMGRGHYHWQHEPCWYAVRKGEKSGWIGDRKQSTIWDIQNMHISQGNVDDGKTKHSTQKPVECMARPMRNHEGDVYEPFAGSGTTLVASHQMKRRCYALEISPQYCQIIVDRMLKLDPGLQVKKNGEVWVKTESLQ